MADELKNGDRVRKVYGSSATGVYIGPSGDSDFPDVVRERGEGYYLFNAFAPGTWERIPDGGAGEAEADG